MQFMQLAVLLVIYTKLLQKQQRQHSHHPPLLQPTKMKQKISISIDEKTVLDIFKAIQTGKFRNKSHVVEFAVKKLLEVENG